MDDTRAVMQLAPLLGGRPGERIRDLLLACDSDERLRAFAVACAALALSAQAHRPPDLEQALAEIREVVLLHPNERAWDTLRPRLKALFDACDEIAFDAFDDVEAGKCPDAAYTDAFRLARAAEALYDTLEPSAKRAAAWCCYDAFDAIFDATPLLELAERELG